MPHTLEEILNPQNALIFRITHRANLPWILRNGLRCRRSEVTDPDFVSIGNVELIGLRATRAVPIPPGGTLDEYVPFYFTPFTPMLYNIKTGYGGIRRRRNDEIVILVSSLVALEECGVQYVFTDRHAYLQAAQFFGDRSQLAHVDFDLLQRRDFRRDPEDPSKVERYQAEALVYGSMPIDAVLGVACYTPRVRGELEELAVGLDLEPKFVVRPGWYFR